MTILSSLRNRFSTRDAPAGQLGPGGNGRAAPATSDEVPFPGFERLDDKQAVEGLRDHSQVELEAVEIYERSHEGRDPVLDKLRYLRGREPLPGYDALSANEVMAALGTADLPTVKKVRAYERKFANRREVVEEVNRVHHRRLASEPAAAVPGYQPMSAANG